MMFLSLPRYFLGVFSIVLLLPLAQANGHIQSVRIGTLDFPAIEGRIDTNIMGVNFTYLGLRLQEKSNRPFSKPSYPAIYREFDLVCDDDIAPQTQGQCFFRSTPYHFVSQSLLSRHSSGFLMPLFSNFIATFIDYKFTFEGVNYSGSIPLGFISHRDAIETLTNTLQKIQLQPVIAESGALQRIHISIGTGFPAYGAVIDLDCSKRLLPVHIKAID